MSSIQSENEREREKEINRWIEKWIWVNNRYVFCTESKQEREREGEYKIKGYKQLGKW